MVWEMVDEPEVHPLKWSPWDHGKPYCVDLYWVSGGVLYSAGEDAWGGSYDIPMKSWVLASSRSVAKRLFIDFWNSEYEADIMWVDPISIKVKRHGVVCITEGVVDPCYRPGDINQVLLDILREWSVAR